MNYFFSLGRTVALCYAELQALLKINQVDYKILHEIENNVIVEVSGNINVEDIQKQSGGIVKIGKLLFVIPVQTGILKQENWIPAGVYPVLRCGAGMTEKDTGKIKDYKNFGVSLVGFQENIVKICEELKKDLKMHYILPKDGYELSSAQIINKNILEYIIVKADDEYQVFQTQCVQDINYWTKKDMGRPFIDDRLGMLPLKVARMMVNLSFSSLSSSRTRGSITLLDPFCGMGSILQEAIDLGINNVIGGDINVNILKKCEQNLNWFCRQFMWQHVNILMINSDATGISEKLNQKVDLIVTEPFLGDARKILTNTNRYYQILSNTNKNIRKNPLAIRKNPNSNKQNIIPENIAIEIKNITKGLERMYMGCLKDWEKVLKPNAVVVIIVPEIELGRKVFTIPFVEICAKTGYNILNSYDYSREKAVVKRKIYLLRQS